MSIFRRLGTAAILISGVARAENSDVRVAVDFAFRELYGQNLSETGLLGELTVSLLQRAIRSRTHEYPPSPHDGVEVGAMVGSRTALCLLNDRSPSPLGVQSREFGSSQKVLARANLTAKAGSRGVLSSSEWDSIVEASSSEPWMHLALCLAAQDIFRSQKLSAASVRAAAAILEERVSSGRSLPDTSGRYALVDTLDLREIQRWSPWVDGWDRGILYKSDGRGFEVISRGTDGVVGPPFCDDHPGSPSSDPDCDLVYKTGGSGHVPPGVSGW